LGVILVVNEETILSWINKNKNITIIKLSKSIGDYFELGGA
jgi:hypothetical protein